LIPNCGKSRIALGCPADGLAGPRKNVDGLLQTKRQSVRRPRGFSRIAEEFDAYPPDLRTLAENVEWTLETAQRVFAHLGRQEWLSQSSGEAGAPKRPRTQIEALCADMRAMVRYGVPRDALPLVEVPGIGSKRAMILHSNGIRSLGALVSTSPMELGAMLRLKSTMIGKMLVAAAEVLETRNVEDPFAIESCDCADFAKGTSQCKHVIRARLERNDARDLLEALCSMRPNPKRALRNSLGDLWMKVGGIYNAFHGCEVDHGGRKFLSRALNPAKTR
jgi:hypothetical protein